MTLPISIPPENIVVRMPNWLGDIVMATPVLADLRYSFPKARITAMCQGSTGDLLMHDPHIDTIFRFKKVSGWIKPTEHGALRDALKKEEFDLGILLTNSFSSAWWFWIAGIPARIGYDTHMRKWLLTHPCTPPTGTPHQVVVYKDLLKQTLDIPLSTTLPQLFVTSQEQEEAKLLLGRYNISTQVKVIGINPSAAFGSAKCWLPERFRQLIERLLIETPHQIVCFGDAVSAPLVHEIVMGLGDRVVNLAGKTNLRQLMALIQSCNLFVSNDSGPMHLAAALRVPLIAIFGSTSSIKTGPYGFGYVIHKNASCSPCYRRSCPVDFRCMTEISVDEVFDKVKELIDAPREF